MKSNNDAQDPASKAGSHETMETGGGHDAKSHTTGKRRKMSDMSQGPGLLDMVSGDDPDEDEGEKLGAASSSIIKFYPDWCKICSCSNSEPLSIDASRWEQVKDFFSCPPKGTFARMILISFILVLFWGFMFYLFRPLSEVNPSKPNRNLNIAWVKGPIFALGIVLSTGLTLGVIIKRYLNLPPLLAPLILGILYNNVDQINVFHLMKSFGLRNCKKDAECLKMAHHSVNSWIKPIRIIALGIILTRAGLELSPKQLTKLKGIVPMLAFGPCVAEACVCAGMSYVFFKVIPADDIKPMSLAMCFAGGFALGAVSPAVVVPGALSLKKAGYGVVKGVPTLLIAASSIDDVLAISLFIICLGFAVKSTEFKDWQIYSGGILGLAVGLTHGIVFGILLHFLPPRNGKSKAEHRLVLLLLLNLCSVMAYDDTFYNSAGSISVIVTSFIAGFGWRSQPHWKRPMHKVERWLALIWMLWVPLIFGTIGKEINLRGELFTGPIILRTLAVIGVSLVGRLIVAFILTKVGTRFNMKECIFVALSWIPKATVQAALAPLVLTRADEQNDESVRIHAEIVVNIAILAVLLTAPLGSILIALTGPKLLEQNVSHEIQEAELEFPNGGGLDPAESTFELVEQHAKMAKKSIEATDLVEVMGSRENTEPSKATNL